MLAAYAFSGFAGLVYEVTWTRLLTLRLGHTTAAASIVLAAFMGGLAIGAAIGGRMIASRSRREAQWAYAALESAALVLALLLPLILAAFTPLLRGAYANGHGGALFAIASGVTALVAMTLPALALGATFPCAIRAVAGRASAGTMYALNTVGASLGAIVGGFVLIPQLGTFGSTLVAAAAALVSVVFALRDPLREPEVLSVAKSKTNRRPPVSVSTAKPSPRQLTILLVVAAASGAATFVLEIGWTRLFVLLVGPSAYAFAGVLALCIVGLAVGSVVGSFLDRRGLGRAGLMICLLVAALAAALSAAAVGSSLPTIVNIVSLPGLSFLAQTIAGGRRLAMIVVPVMLALGAAFPLLLALARQSMPAAPTASWLYAVNTSAAVVGALLAGFVFLPRLGLERTLAIAAGLLSVAALGATFLAERSPLWRSAGAVIALAALALAATPAGWDRDLLASGAYKYGRDIPAAVDRDVALKAGRLLYYRDGAASTVSVRERAGVRALSIDGKVDASSGSDMVTQKLLAHMPLLLHEHPDHVAIIGFGSGVTAGAALTHPVSSVDVVELSPDVVAASQFFARENRQALADPRLHLIVGDGRSHMALAGARYDVIVSEPSNPWMAGVAALFTREFFAAARERLAPGGVLCQWAHTYDISDADLRSVVATFLSVFPEGSLWLIGDGDLLMLGSHAPLNDRIATMASRWGRGTSAIDLAGVGVTTPFALLASFVAGGTDAARYAGAAPLQRDRFMALEFSGPRAVNDEANDNVPALLDVQRETRRASWLSALIASATAGDWRGQARMLFKAGAFSLAHDSFMHALAVDPDDAASAVGALDAASRLGSIDATVQQLRVRASQAPDAIGPKVALSKWRASTGDAQGALGYAEPACRSARASVDACAQLASIYIDAGAVEPLDAVVRMMAGRFNGQPQLLYAQAALAFLNGDLAGAQQHGELAVSAEPSRAVAWNLRGAVAATRGDRRTARTSFETAISLDPSDPTTYVNLAQLEREDGRRAEAARWFAEALTVDPTSTAAREGLAQTR